MSVEKTVIEAKLAEFWDENVVEVEPEGEHGIDDMLTPLDSQTAVVVLLELEELVKKKLPIATTVKKGGYKSKEEFVTELATAVMEELGKKL